MIWRHIREESLYWDLFMDRMIDRLRRKTFFHSMKDIEDALARSDAAAVTRCAHTLKGATASIHASAANRAAEALETAGRRGDDGQLDPLAQALTLEIGRVVDYVRDSA